MDVKQCTKCGETKPLSEFQKRVGAKDGHRGACRQCENKRKAAWAKSNPDKTTASSRASYQKHIDKRRKSGAQNAASRRAENPEKFRESNRRLYWQKPEKFRAAALRRRIKNIEAARERDRLWAKKNPGLNRAKAAKFRTQRPKSLLKSDLDEIKFVYNCCVVWAKLTKVEHHVDHIVPLRGKEVSGLHVPWNLRIIPASENLSKGNRLDPNIPMMYY